MTEFLGRIVDTGPSTAHNGRKRAQLHIEALTAMDHHPFHRKAGEALCNPHLLANGTARAAPHEPEATCNKCLTRADRYGVRVVIAPGSASEEPAAE